MLTLSTGSSNSFQSSAFLSTTSTTGATLHCTPSLVATTTTTTDSSNLKLTLKLSRKRTASSQSEDEDDEESTTVVATIESPASKKAKASTFVQLQHDVFELYYNMSMTIRLLGNPNSAYTEQERIGLQAKVATMEAQYKELQRELEQLRKYQVVQDDNEHNNDHYSDTEDEEDGEDSDSPRDSLDETVVDELSDYQGEFDEQNRTLGRSSSKKHVRIMLENNVVFHVERLRYVWEENNIYHRDDDESDEEEEQYDDEEEGDEVY